jgi:hypothetical protein
MAVFTRPFERVACVGTCFRLQPSTWGWTEGDWFVSELLFVSQFPISVSSGVRRRCVFPRRQEKGAETQGKREKKQGRPCSPVPPILPTTAFFELSAPAFESSKKLMRLVLGWWGKRSVNGTYLQCGACLASSMTHLPDLFRSV